tara:strand:+ start:399 stop:584 length:186 start_codon:yes stop_codon:yes gene_type:complete
LPEQCPSLFLVVEKKDQAEDQLKDQKKDQLDVQRKELEEGVGERLEGLLYITKKGDKKEEQ